MKVEKIAIYIITNIALYNRMYYHSQADENLTRESYIRKTLKEK